jgi:hypothetical protein
MNHPTWKNKLDNIESIRVTTAKFNGNLLLQIKPIWCKKFITISWRKCKTPKINKPLTTENNENKYENKYENACNINNTSNNIKLLNGAMRYSIRKQISEFRKNNKFILKKCSLCHKTSNLQVDHIIAFVKLQKDFLQNADTQSIPTKFNYNRKTCQPKFKKEHVGFNRRWQNYHRKHAQFQWLCKLCNIKKSNK